jgi:mono/diheme cytochrome c family protein
MQLNWNTQCYGLALRLALTINAALATATAFAADKPAVDLSKLPPAATNKIEFAKDILPIFKKSCVDCHGPDVQMGDYRLDSRELALKKGEHVIAIVPGKSEQSPLIHYVARLVKDMDMPPEGNDPLSKEQIGLLRAWIDQRAK